MEDFFKVCGLLGLPALYQELCLPAKVVHTPPRLSEISMKNLRAKVIGEASFDIAFIIQNLNLAGLAVLVSW